MRSEKRSIYTRMTALLLALILAFPWSAAASAAEPLAAEQIPVTGKGEQNQGNVFFAQGLMETAEPDDGKITINFCTKLPTAKLAPGITIDNYRDPEKLKEWGLLEKSVRVEPGTALKEAIKAAYGENTERINDNWQQGKVTVANDKLKFSNAYIKDSNTKISDSMNIRLYSCRYTFYWSDPAGDSSDANVIQKNIFINNGWKIMMVFSNSSTWYNYLAGRNKNNTWPKMKWSFRNSEGQIEELTEETLVGAEGQGRELWLDTEKNGRILKFFKDDPGIKKGFSNLIGIYGRYTSPSTEDSAFAEFSKKMAQADTAYAKTNWTDGTRKLTGEERISSNLSVWESTYTVRFYLSKPDGSGNNLIGVWNARPGQWLYQDYIGAKKNTFIWPYSNELPTDHWHVAEAGDRIVTSDDDYEVTSDLNVYFDPEGQIPVCFLQSQPDGKTEAAYNIHDVILVDPGTAFEAACQAMEAKTKNQNKDWTEAVWMGGEKPSKVAGDFVIDRPLTVWPLKCNVIFYKENPEETKLSPEENRIISYSDAFAYYLLEDIVQRCSDKNEDFKKLCEDTNRSFDWSIAEETRLSECVDENGDVIVYQIPRRTVATILREGETLEYSDLQEAFDAVQAGETILLCADVTMRSKTPLVIRDKAGIKVDFNEHRILSKYTGSGERYEETALLQIEGSSVTLTGSGRISMGAAWDTDAYKTYAVRNTGTGTLVIEGAVEVNQVINEGTLTLNQSVPVGRIQLTDGEKVTIGGAYPADSALTIALGNWTDPTALENLNKAVTVPLKLARLSYSEEESTGFADKAVLADSRDKKAADNAVVLSRKDEDGQQYLCASIIGDIYVNGETGDDENSGLSKEAPVQTFEKAKELLEKELAETPEKYKENIKHICVTGTIPDARGAWQMPEGTSLIRHKDFTGCMVRVKEGDALTLGGGTGITVDGNKGQVTASSAMIEVPGNGTLKLASGAELKNNKNNSAQYESSGGAVLCRGTVEINDGTVISGNESNAGGAILLNGGTGAMNGGLIKRNTAERAGGGILLCGAASFTLNSGTISYCTAINGNGGAISAGVKETTDDNNPANKLVMNGGLLEWNNARDNTGGDVRSGRGGGIYVQSNGCMEMNSGVIRSNYATSNGGGINIETGATGTITGGQISSNWCDGDGGYVYGLYGGGGIYVNTGGVMQIPGRTVIKKNRAASEGRYDAYGGGIAACPTSRVSLYLTNGSAIFDNGASDVYLANQLIGEHIIHIPEYMFSGDLYRWTDVDTGKTVMDDYLDTLMLSEKPVNMKSNCDESAKTVTGDVLISGNWSKKYGGGIGTNGTVIIGTGKTELSVTVTKVWDDKDDAAGKRPESVDLWLLRNGERVTFTTLKTDGTQTHVFTDLPGNASEYTIEEALPEGTKPGDYAYEATVKRDEDNPAEFTVTNRLKRDLQISKTVAEEAPAALAAASYRFQIRLTDGEGNPLLSEDGTAPYEVSAVLYSPNPDCEEQDKDSEKEISTELTGTVTEGILKIKDHPVIELKSGERIVLKSLPEDTNYEVREKNVPGGMEPSITVNGTAAILKPVVKGTIGAAGTVTFVAVTNTYRASGSARILAAKLLEGREWTANDRFELQLTEITEGETADRLTAPLKKTADAGNKTVFFDLNYTKAGSHVYQVEELAGNMGGITYDTKKYTVRVAVKDNGDGTLNTAVTYPEGEIVFRNQYYASGSLSLKGTKRLTGGRKTLLADDEFTFRVTENGTQVATGKSRADGSIEFTEIPYTLQDVGTHVYEIREIKGSDGNLTYSDAVLTVTAEVTDSGNGVLNVKASYPSGGIVFENQYVQKQKAAVEVTKKLVYDGAGLIAADQIFYVALYSDEACTRLATDIRPLVFKNASAAVVKFSDLEPERTYYVGECDVEGNAVLSGVISDGALFAVNFAEGKQSVVTEPNKTVRFTFENEFFEIPETGFYKEGELTITKNLLDAGGNAAESDRVFYAGIFADEAYTILSDRVSANVVALDLNGGSSVSEMVTVSIKPGESVTLYVTEVDENGVPVDQLSDFAYGVSIDQTEVTLDEISPFVSVTITNQETEVETETEITTETEKKTEKKEEKPKTVKTGDDTPVAVWLMIGLLSLCCVILLLFAGRRGRGTGTS